MIQDPESRIQGDWPRMQFWIQTPGSWIVDPGCWIQDPKSLILDPGSSEKDPGPQSNKGILDPPKSTLDPRMTRKFCCPWIQNPPNRTLDLRATKNASPGSRILRRGPWTPEWQASSPFICLVQQCRCRLMWDNLILRS